MIEAKSCHSIYHVTGYNQPVKSLNWGDWIGLKKLSRDTDYNWKHEILRGDWIEHAALVPLQERNSFESLS